MSTQLDILLSQIGADWAQAVESRAWDAASSNTASFTVTRNTLAIREELCRYVQLIDKAIGKQPDSVDYPDNHFWELRVRGLLAQLFGEHGESALADLMSSGSETQGMPGLLRQMTAHIIRDHIAEVVNQRVECFCSRLTAEQWMETAEEYLAKYGHLIPQEVKYGGATRIKLHLRELLLAHYRMTTRLSQLP